jgi:hypothetical protein
MNTEQPKEKKGQEEDPSLRAAIKDGISYAVMMGSGETYLGPFGIFLRASTLQVGLLATVPQLFGAMMQWVYAVRMDRFRSRRKVILAGATTQAVAIIPMALLPFLFGSGTLSVLYLLGLMMVYQGACGSTVPIWNSLIGDLVPANLRGRFFGQRNRLTGMSSFVSLLLAGGILDLFDRAGKAEVGFLVIFSVAFLARLNSVRWLSKYRDPELHLTRLSPSGNSCGALRIRILPNSYSSSQRLISVFPSRLPTSPSICSVTSASPMWNSPSSAALPRSPSSSPSDIGGS